MRETSRVLLSWIGWAKPVSAAVVLMFGSQLCFGEKGCQVTVTNFDFDQLSGELFVSADTCCTDNGGVTRCNEELISCEFGSIHWTYYDWCELSCDPILCNGWPGPCSGIGLEQLAYPLGPWDLTCVDWGAGPHDVGVYSAYSHHEMCPDGSYPTVLGPVNIIDDQYTIDSFEHRRDTEDPNLIHLVVGWTFLQAGGASLQLFLVNPSGGSTMEAWVIFPEFSGEEIVHSYQYDPFYDGWTWRIESFPCHRELLEETLPYTPPPEDQDGTESDRGGRPIFDEKVDRCEEEPAVGLPVRLTNGNMRFQETDPLPATGTALAVRAYDSLNDDEGWLGRGWFSPFDARLTFEGSGYYRVLTADNRAFYFYRHADGTYSYSGPSKKREPTLSVDSSSGQYVFRGVDDDVSYFFARPPDGSLRRVRAASTGEGFDVELVDGLPTGVFDAFGRWSWDVVADVASHRITQIRSGQTTLDYAYGGGSGEDQLSDVDLNGSPWRSYWYDDYGRLEDIVSGGGVLIERHEYYPLSDPDHPGWARTSEGPTESIIDIQYHVESDLPRPLNLAAGEYAARVTYLSGLYSVYYIRPTPSGVHRVVEVRGACTCPTVGDFAAMVFDEGGRMTRKQGGRGFITTWDHDGSGRLLTERHGMAPSGCDPSTDPEQCRVASVDELAVLELTEPVSETTYAYEDPEWPGRPTAICRSSVVPGHEEELACTHLEYDVATGATLTETVSGWIARFEGEPPIPAPVERTTTYLLYSPEGDPPSVAPSFDPREAAAAVGVEITFEEGWLALDQPVGRLMEVNGPLDGDGGGDDRTLFVYYPVDDIVPARLRGKVAARMDALGDVSFFDDYDERGSLVRVIGLRGVAEQTLYDGAGRVEEQRMLGNCNPLFGFDEDPLCYQDLVTRYEYQPGFGPLSAVTRPTGESMDAYSHDQWGRVRTRARGSSAADLRERIQYTYSEDGWGTPVLQEVQGCVEQPCS
ncbi:MAG: DUF6531 domain-containing protein, partial [Gemmatimonadota bacterium]